MMTKFWAKLACVFAMGLFPLLSSAQLSAVKLNEIFASNVSFTNSDCSVTDIAELYNSGTTPVDLANCSLTDSNAFPRRYVFPPNTFIAPNGYRSIRFASSQPMSTNNAAFGLKSKGGYLYFFGPQTNFLDVVSYGMQALDFSLGRTTPGGANWVLNVPTLGRTNIAAAMGLPSALKINEWMANPSSGEDYFELYNSTNKPVAIGGISLTDTRSNRAKFVVPALSFIGVGDVGAYIKFVADGTTQTPFTPADHVNFSLSNNGEAVGLYDTDHFTEIDYVAFGAQSSGISEGRLPDGGTNFVRFLTINGYDTISPGEPNFLILTNVIVNELLSHTDPPFEDAIEFLNAGTTGADISGWWLSNSRINRKRYRLPNGPALTNGGFRVIYEGIGSSVGFNSSSAADPFTFNSAHGDKVTLSQVDAAGNLTGYIVYEEFESAANGVSFGHYNTSVPGDYKFVALSNRTFGVDAANTLQEFRLGTGKVNSPPKVGPVVINEIMFAPTNTFFDGSPLLRQNPNEEYIELRSVTNGTVLLYDPEFPTNRWKLQKAIEFTFPPLSSLPPNAFCLIVGFDPATNAAALDNFRTRFGVSNNVAIFGPWTGRLSDGGDSVELYRPDPVQLPPHPDAGFVPYIRVDKVNYGSSPQWPQNANGTGNSLQRANSQRFGNDPINWTGATPTAGRPTASEFLDSDGDGIPDSWEVAHGFNPNNPADGALDADGDGLSNFGEYVAGSDPYDAQSRLMITGIIPAPDTNSPALVRFTAFANQTYTVQYRNSMAPDSDWQKLGDVSSASSNRVEEVADPTAGKKADRYYRVVAPATD